MRNDITKSAQAKGADRPPTTPARDNTLRHRSRSELIKGAEVISACRTSELLAVTHDGTGCKINPAIADRGIAGRLAALMEGDFDYLLHGRAGTLAVINFPIGTPSSVSDIIFSETFDSLYGLRN